MELESLKYIWKTIDAAPAFNKTEDRQDEMILGAEQERKWLVLLKKKSKGPVESMTRHLFFELAGVAALYTPLMAWYVFYSGGKLAAISWFLLLMITLFVAFFFRMRKLLRGMFSPDCQVSKHLKRQVRILEQYTRVYLVAGTLLIPVTACLLGGLYYWKLPPPLHPGLIDPGPDNPLWQVAVRWLLGLSTVTTGMYFVNKWYINRLYGQYITRLREALKEISSVA